MEKNKVVIRLMGHDYPMVSDMPADKLKRMANYVDQKMREIGIISRASESQTAILASMTLAEELFRAQDENLRLRRELAAKESEK